MDRARIMPHVMGDDGYANSVLELWPTSCQGLLMEPIQKAILSQSFFSFSKKSKSFHGRDTSCSKAWYAMSEDGRTLEKGTARGMADKRLKRNLLIPELRSDFRDLLHSILIFY